MDKLALSGVGSSKATLSVHEKCVSGCTNPSVVHGESKGRTDTQSRRLYAQSLPMGAVCRSETQTRTRTASSACSDGVWHPWSAWGGWTGWSGTFAQKSCKSGCTLPAARHGGTKQDSSTRTRTRYEDDNPVGARCKPEVQKSTRTRSSVCVDGAWRGSPEE